MIPFNINSYTTLKKRWLKFAERATPPITYVLGITLFCTSWWGFSSVDLGNMEYHFIPITQGSTFILNSIWFDLVLWHINRCRLFNAKSSLYIYIKYIRFGWVAFYDISTIVSYLMPNTLYTYIKHIRFGLAGFHGISTIVGYLMPNPLLYIYIKYIRFGLVAFYEISTIVGYLMPNTLYTYILNIYDLVWFGFMTYQPL